MVRRLVVVAVALASAAPARADEARDPDEAISIARLVELAVRKSSVLTLVRANARLANLGEITAGAAFEWRLQSSVAVDTQRAAPIANATAQVLEDTRVTGTIAMAKQLSTGGDLSLQFTSREQSRVFGEAPQTPVGSGLASLSVELSQPLLRGRGQGAHVDQRKAAIGATAATLVAHDESASTIRDLIAAYWELAYARASLTVRKQSLALAQSQLELTRKMHDRGALPDSAVKAARYGVALREEARLRAADAVQSASLQLRRLAGLEIGIELGDLAPTDALVIPTESVDVEGSIAIALADNPRIAAARLGIKISDVELRHRRNLALPSIDIGASAGAIGIGPDRIGAFEALGTGVSYQLAGQVSLSWEIGGAARAAAEAARVEKANARLSAMDVERDVIAAVIDIVRRVRAARQRAEVAERAIELATSNLETELALFRADKSSNVLVFERQTELDEARLLASRAAADCQIALATLDYLNGHLLERHGAEVVSTTNRSSK